jgi:hypothetical protein
VKPPKSIPMLGAVVAVAIAIAGGQFVRSADASHPARAVDRSAATGAGLAERGRPGIDPRSCKPQPPLLMTLEPGTQPGLWRLHVEAIETLPDARVTLGASTDGHELTTTQVWRGAIERGATRDFELSLVPPAGATEIWASGDAMVGAAAGMRSYASLPVLNGHVVATIAPKPSAARSTTNPVTGETVVEYQGVSGGQR